MSVPEKSSILWTWLCKSALKGHDFSRAAKRTEVPEALATEGCLGRIQAIPRRLKPEKWIVCVIGTTKVVPFQNPDMK
jgi:hypothetical protein